MTYFELRDDVAVPERWHLGEITLSDGTEPRLRSGLSFSSEGKLFAEVTDPGRVLEFCLTSFAVPVATRAVAREVGAIARTDVQCVPVEIGGQSGMEVLNVLRVVRCLDERRSAFTKWTGEDHRADPAEQYRQVTELSLDKTAIAPDAHVFRVEGWLVALIVSEDVKAAMERVGCLGARFLDV